ncbi:glycosyltransferase family 2 protein [Solitalea koreensis]|uniref:Glycosyl transferase family 2 n=1 Tax=Solitalea koreensis TaxID=543615 RepID=A0A521CPF9_9SPHI|nr:glycosyltransferase family 2 protein [Solitalea koreensis]SMO60641.1 Glycosyl transferase family 2 [Solitalea koreensis]
MQGGYRTQHISSKKTENLPVLSVITIVYNGADLIARTMKSVLSQTYSNIEYIIVDGASTDNTLDLIKKQEAQIALWVSEKDKGIYDAMNKGLELATGDYILYMNAGDQFFANDTVEKIFAKDPKADIYYGDTLIVDDEGNSLGPRRLRPPQQLNWKSFRYGMLVCHQSFVVRRSLAPAYDLHYKIAADIDWCINCLKDAKTIINTEIFIARYLSGGASWQNQKQALKERFDLMQKHYGTVSVITSHVVIAARYIKFRLQRGKTTN